MTAPAKTVTRPLIAMSKLRRALADRGRWRILDLLQQRGPMTTEFVSKATGLSRQNTSKHLIFMRDAGMLEQRMGKLYAIPDVFLVSGERTLDFGAVVLRLDQAAEKK